MLGTKPILRSQSLFYSPCVISWKWLLKTPFSIATKLFNSNKLFKEKSKYVKDNHEKNYKFFLKQ